MSGGNQRKVCLAAALVCDPPIVLLDEATSGVDFTSRTMIWSLISSLKNKTIIMATHTLEECEKIADNIMVMSQGTIEDYDTPTHLRLKYNCGYIIETDRSNKEALSSIIEKSIGRLEPLSETQEIIKYNIPIDDSTSISDILKEIKFEYILTLQSLEEKIFDHIQEKEEEITRQKDLASIMKKDKKQTIESMQDL